jgi:hypothetical protein
MTFLQRGTESEFLETYYKNSASTRHSESKGNCKHPSNISEQKHGPLYYLHTGSSQIETFRCESITFPYSVKSFMSAHCWLHISCQNLVIKQDSRVIQVTIADILLSKLLHN